MRSIMLIYVAFIVIIKAQTTFYRRRERAGIAFIWKLIIEFRIVARLEDTINWSIAEVPISNCLEVFKYQACHGKVIFKQIFDCQLCTNKFICNFPSLLGTGSCSMGWLSLDLAPWMLTRWFNKRSRMRYHINIGISYYAWKLDSRR